MTKPNKHAKDSNDINGHANSQSKAELGSQGSPVLGYLATGILIGPYGLSIIRHVHGTKAIAEFGVVFLLFKYWS